jgi:uncharacterized protein YbjT (DUF2867 family)
VALEHPERFVGERIEIASDELTAADMAEMISRATGRSFPVEQARSDDLGPGLVALFDWLRDTGHDVELQGLRRHFPEVGWHGFDQWISSLTALTGNDR